MWILKESLHNDYVLGIWKIEEEENFFWGQFPLDEARLSTISNPSKRLEFLASRYVAAILSEVPKEALILNKANRAPYFPHLSYSISISHCDGYVAVLLGKNGNPVGLDIEICNEKIMRVADRFISEEEQAPDHQTILAQTLCWSVKEAVFKLLDIPGITFKSELRIQNWDKQTAEVAVEHTNFKGTVAVHYRVLEQIPGLVLAYTVQ